MSRSLHLKLTSANQIVQLTSNVDLAEPRMILTSYNVKMAATDHGYNELHVRSRTFFSSGTLHSTTSGGGGVSIPIQIGASDLISFAPNRLVEVHDNIPSRILFEILDGNGTLIDSEKLTYIHLHFSYEDA